MPTNSNRPHPPVSTDTLDNALLGELRRLARSVGYPPAFHRSASRETLIAGLTRIATGAAKAQSLSNDLGTLGFRSKFTYETMDGEPSLVLHASRSVVDKGRESGRSEEVVHMVWSAGRYNYAASFHSKFGADRRVRNAAALRSVLGL